MKSSSIYQGKSKVIGRLREKWWEFLSGSRACSERTLEGAISDSHDSHAVDARLPLITVSKCFDAGTVQLISGTPLGQITINMFITIFRHLDFPDETFAVCLKVFLL
jgi:hypothetical protein